jgi:hypothetical protein
VRPPLRGTFLEGKGATSSNQYGDSTGLSSTTKTIA